MAEYSDQSQAYLNKDDVYYGHERQELLKFIPQGTKKILDVGCGVGAFGRFLKSRMGVEVWGIEPNEEALEAAKNNLDKAILGIFDENNPEIENEKFDLICFNDVLEHLLNPADTLRICRKYLSPTGRILASVPNVLFFPVFFDQIIIKQDWKYVNAGTLDETHLRFFTKKSIIRLFLQAGYEIERIQGINSDENYRRYKIVNTLLLNRLYDWRFLQFAVVAK